MALRICRCAEGAEVEIQIFFVLAKWSDQFLLVHLELKGRKL